MTLSADTSSTYIWSDKQATLIGISIRYAVPIHIGVVVLASAVSS